MIRPDSETVWDDIHENAREIIADYLAGLNDAETADVMYELMQNKEFEGQVIEAFFKSELWTGLAERTLEARMQEPSEPEDLPGAER